MKYLKKTAAYVLVILAMCLVFFAVPVSAAPRFAKKKITVKAGNAFVLDIKGNKKNAKVKWKISSKARLEIISKTNYRIVLYAKKSGKVKVTAKIGKTTLSSTVTVKKNSDFPETLTLVKGKGYSFKVPSKATWSYRYLSLDGGIAEMTAKGNTAELTVKKPGELTVFAKTASKTYSCKVTVIKDNGVKPTSRETMSVVDGYPVIELKKYANNYGYCKHWFAEVDKKYIYVLAEGNSLYPGDGLVLGIQSNMKKLNIESRGTVSARWLSDEETASLSWASDYEYRQILQIDAKKTGKGYVDLYGTVKGIEIRMTIPIIVR